VEELSYRLNEISVKLDRLQNELNYATGRGTPPEGLPADQATQLAPGPSNLGAMPPGANAAAPLAGGDRAVLTPPGKPAEAGAIAATGTGGIASGKFEAAMDQLARGAYDQARAAFRALADQHPGHQLAPEALYWAGDISYSAKKDYQDAARRFAELLKKYPKAPHAPEAMLKLGQSLIALGQKKEGCATLAAFPAKYPSASKTLTTRSRSEAKKAACT
jgi:tol-pal system protein YbgF